MAGMSLQAQWDTEHIKEKKWVERKRIRKGHKELRKESDINSKNKLSKESKTT